MGGLGGVNDYVDSFHGNGDDNNVFEVKILWSASFSVTFENIPPLLSKQALESAARTLLVSKDVRCYILCRMSVSLVKANLLPKVPNYRSLAPPLPK